MGYGEKKGDREALRQLQRDAMDSGVKPAKARKMAETAMREVDRRLSDQGKR